MDWTYEQNKIESHELIMFFHVSHLKVNIAAKSSQSENSDTYQFRGGMNQPIFLRDRYI